MLPIYTSAQLKDGIQSGDLMLDLSEYMKKKDGEALTSKVDELEVALGAKLDASPQHKHQIDDIKQLEVALDGKFDKGEKYPHNQILSDVEKIAYIEAPRVNRLVIAAPGSDYTFYVDDKSGDLMITRESVLIGTYYVASGKWSWEQEQEQACSCEPALEALASKVDNHTHETLDNDLTVNGTIKSNQLCCDTITFDTINENTGKCSINGSEIWRIQKNSWMYIYKILSLSQSLLVDENATVRKNLNVKESLTLNGWDVETKIKEIEAILKNHYDALLTVCEKLGMIDNNTSDGDKITPQAQAQ